MSAKPVYIQTPEFRVSFPAVFKPRQFKGKGEAKYSIAMLFENGTDLEELKEACRKVARDKWGDDLDGIKWPFRNGNDKAAKKGMEAYKDTIHITASTKSRPQVIQPDAKTLIVDDEAAFYPGCYARAIVNAFTYENDGRGVSFGLGNIQKVRDGDKIGGRPAAEDQFDPVETGADDPANYANDDMVDSGPTGAIEL